MKKTSSASTMRVDKREIPGASDKVDDAPNILEVRKSNRGRVPKRQWSEVEAPKPRKRRQTAYLLTPNSTQNTTQTSTNSFIIYEDEIATKADLESINEPPESSQRAQKRRQKQAWELQYAELKSKSTKCARDYLVQLIGNDEFPEVLKTPKLPPKVLIEEPFTRSDPLSIWRKFITEEDILFITNSTNKNAAQVRKQQRLTRPPGVRHKQKRPWKKLTTAEVGGYFGALFLLGTQGAASLVDNWKTSEDSPLYPIREYISLNRFQQISRYLKVNAPGKANDSLKDCEFWYKVDPLVSSFRSNCKANLKPGTIFAIDEQLRRNRGRWKHALQISSKADSKGVKIYSLCQGYYCYDFLFASKVAAVPEARKFTPHDSTAKPFSTSESVVLTLATQLQEQHKGEKLSLTLACDNFFTTHKLFSELRYRGIAAYGTAKSGSGMPVQQILLRECTDKATDYGLLCNSVFNGVNHVTFVDQKAVHMMTTTHDVKNEEFAWRDARTRRNACLERSREKAGRTELPYPQLSHDYNQGMNSCDVASQVWSYYSVARYSHWRNWWPMLWLILDASIANVLYLYRLKGFTETDLSHRDLQTTIGLQLLRNPACVLRNREPQTAVIGLKPSRIEKPRHNWCKPGRGKRGDCEQCKWPAGKAGRPWKDIRTPLQEISTNPRPRQRRRGPRSSYKCKECDVWLCRDSGCWTRFHHEVEACWDTGNR
jgi:hypothetical protein